MECDKNGNAEHDRRGQAIWIDDSARQRILRLEPLVLAIARAYCLRDAKAHLHAESVRPYIPEEHRFELHATPCQMQYAGAPQTAISRLRQGNLGIDDQLRPWTAEFFHGLKLTGALSQKETGKFRVDVKRHPELVADISEWRIAGKLGNDDGFGRRRLVGCLAASHLPLQDPQGDAFVAGLFAGARLSSIEGEQWLELPDGDEIQKLLEDWTFLHYPSRDIRGRSYVKVSPFYAAFFADLMPDQSRQRILTIRKPAMCPLLPVLYWEWMFGPGKKGMRILPFANALPFGCSVRSFYRWGWQRKDLHRKAVLEYKILAVNFRLRVLMQQWFGAHLAMRNGSNHDVQQIA